MTLGLVSAHCRRLYFINMLRFKQQRANQDDRNHTRVVAAAAALPKARLQLQALPSFNSRHQINHVLSVATTGNGSDSKGRWDHSSWGTKNVPKSLLPKLKHHSRSKNPLTMMQNRTGTI